MLWHSLYEYTLQSQRFLWETGSIQHRSGGNRISVTWYIYQPVNSQPNSLLSGNIRFGLNFSTIFRKEFFFLLSCCVAFHTKLKQQQRKQANESYYAHDIHSI